MFKERVSAVFDFEDIKRYWEERAANDSSAQSTTQDFYLREIEFNVLTARINKYSPSLVADVGCGDGRTTSRLASVFKDTSFTGFDYSRSMIENAKSLVISGETARVKFNELDILQGLPEAFDLIYTTRCLINLPSWELQQTAIAKIHDALTEEGVYVMVENFIEGHNNLNQVRKDYGLPEILVREHNHFFQRQRLLDYAGELFKVEEDINISSTYYLVSRVIYSKLCAERGEQPDYFDNHHRFAVGLPFCGEYGPVRLICFRK